MDRAARLTRFHQTDLYVVITEAFCAGRSAVAVLESALAGGVRLIQMREKDLDGKALLEQARIFREMTRRYDALLIIDDRVDIALACRADGVHLGQDDLPVDAARALAPELILGASSHDLDEALAAQNAGADYVNIGPIFATQTKSVPTGVVGPEMIDTIVPHLSIPFTCMGGIKAHNVHEVVCRGARHVAVVTAVTAAENVSAAARTLIDSIRSSVH